MPQSTITPSGGIAAGSPGLLPGVTVYAPNNGGTTAQASQAATLAGGTGVSPTVVTDSNIRESTIPNTVSAAGQYLNSGTNGHADPAGSVVAPSTAVSGTSTGGSGADYSNMSYQDMYSSVLNGLSGQPVDPTVQAEMNLINGMQANQDAVTQSSIAAIQQQYQARLADAQASQKSTTAGLNQALNLGGSSRYAPVSSSGILSSKESYDMQQLNDLQSAENTQIAQLRQAQQDKNYQLMSEQLSLLDKTRQEKITMANSIVQNMKDYRNYQLDVRKFNETSENDAATRANQAQQILQGKYEFRDLKDDFGNTIGTQVFDKSTGNPVSNISVPGSGVAAPGSNGALQPVSLGSNGKPDPDQQTAFLNTLPAPIRAVVSGLISYRGAPPNPRTSQGQHLIALAEQADPTFDSANYAARASYLKNLDSGTLSQGVASANKVVNHLVSFLSAAQSLPNGAVDPKIGFGLFGPGINTISNSVLGGAGALIGADGIQRAEAQATQQANGLKDEMAKFFKGTGSTDVRSIEDWGNSLDPNAAPGTQKGTVQGTLDLFSGQINSLIAQYTNTMGKAPSIGTIIQPETTAKLSQLKDAGFTIDIPGVPYTNPVAFANANPDNASLLSSIRQQFPDLTPAQALQLAQYQQP